MTRRGRKPQPTAVKLLRGAFDKNPNRFNHSEPAPPQDPIRAPDGLDAPARACWRRTVKSLQAMNVFGSTDADSIEQYARVWSLYRRLARQVEKEGVTIVEFRPTGNVTKKNPAYVAMLDAHDRLARYQSEFGFTPSSRSSLKVNSSEPTTSKVLARSRA